MTSGHRPNLAAAHFRADSLRKLRDFFFQAKVLEVETPALSRGISLDNHIDVFSTPYHALGYAKPGSETRSGSDTWYLQTSPEPHMKRLLCQGFPDIYQICKAYRNGERGARHNPEFTMVEWYRRGFTLAELMQEVEAVCILLAGIRPLVRLTYREAFQQALGIDPLACQMKDLQALATEQGGLPASHLFETLSEALEFLMAHLVEPGFDPHAYTLVRDFPAEQAAQAQLLASDCRLAQRFEVYGGGMELGNGYLELVDADEYEARFDLENLKRRKMGKPELPKDPNLLSALRAGFPECAGVAMGFDRLLMVAGPGEDIGSVLNFPWETA